MKSDKNSRLPRLIPLIAVFLSNLVLWPADAASEDKSKYSLFNPTPIEHMRDFSTDRPDKTEAAYTVDAGHFQHETDLLNVSIDQAQGSTDVSYLFFAPNIKAGLTNRIDLQLVMESFTYQQSGGRKTSSGNGDLTTRLKVNMWGNDGGSTALALMPYVKTPVNRGEVGNDKVEGGLIAPFALDFDERTGIGLMTQYDLLAEEDGSGYYVQFVNSATIGTDFSEDFGGYAEIWSALASGLPASVTLDFGITYAYDDKTRFDIGLNTGITDAADDLNPFIGLSQLF